MLDQPGGEGIWRDSSFVPGWLGSGQHKFPELGEAMLPPKWALSVSPAKTVLHGDCLLYTSTVLKALSAMKTSWIHKKKLVKKYVMKNMDKMQKNNFKCALLRSL